MSRVKTYAMSLIMVAVTVVQVIIGYTTDGIAQDEWLQIAVSFFTALIVYLVPNVPQYPWIKTAAGGALVLLNGLIQFVEGGVTTEEWYMLAVAVLGFFGLIAAPKTKTPID